MTQFGRISAFARRATSAGFRFFVYIEPYRTSGADSSTGHGNLNREFNGNIGHIVFRYVPMKVGAFSINH
jgi:hypothetical protein